MAVQSYLRYLWLPGLLLAAHLALTGCRTAVDEAQQRLLEQHLAKEAPAASALKAFYAAREYRAMWVHAGGPSRQTVGLIDAWCAADGRGLLAGHEAPASLEQALRAAYVDAPEDDSARAEGLAALELRLALTALGLADRLANGIPASDASKARWHAKKPGLDSLAFLSDAAENGPSAALERLETRHHGYTALREVLARHRRLAEAGGWPRVPGPAPLQKGDAGASVAALRQRLAATEDLADTTASDAFDADVEAAVQRFQRRHGLPADGVVGTDVLASLNVPVEERIAQLEVNLERHRWLPESFGDDYVYVNIPDYHLYGYRGGRPAVDMPVVVGKVMNQTPAFTDTMTHVVFRPYWNVPSSIATEEILPQMERNPGYLARHRYELVDKETDVVPVQRASLDALEAYRVRIRQQPGPGNALGLVKFMFPNENNIYLHDTPADHLFDRAERGFSHGCVRVERPADLAAFVLREEDGGWSMERIKAAMDGDEDNLRVDLEHPLPVYLVYLTAWVDAAGRVQFREDLYGLDAPLAQALRPRRADAARAACTSLTRLIEEID